MVIHLIVALMLALGIGSGLNVPEFSPALVLAETSTAPETPPEQEKKKSVIKFPTHNSLPDTLSPALFGGAVKEGYIIAQTIPDVLAGLHCYCGCDQSMGHGNLLDCFVDDHAAG